MSIPLKRNYFNALAPRWDSLPAPPDAAARAAEFARRALPAGAERVLDLGCGTGILLPHLASLAAQVVEADVAENMLAVGRKKHADYPALPVCASGERLPFRPRAFDAVVCFSALPHFPDLDTALRAMAAVLKPEGTLTVGHLLGSFELNEFHSRLDPAVNTDRLPAAAELARLLEDAGFEAVVLEERPDWYFVQAKRRAHAP